MEKEEKAPEVSGGSGAFDGAQETTEQAEAEPVKTEKREPWEANGEKEDDLAIGSERRAVKQQKVEELAPDSVEELAPGSDAQKLAPGWQRQGQQCREHQRRGVLSTRGGVA